MDWGNKGTVAVATSQARAPFHSPAAEQDAGALGGCAWLVVPCEGHRPAAAGLLQQRMGGYSCAAVCASAWIIVEAEKGVRLAQEGGRFGTGSAHLAREHSAAVSHPGRGQAAPLRQACASGCEASMAWWKRNAPANMGAGGAPGCHKPAAVSAIPCPAAAPHLQQAQHGR
jgi:hypothetical protein